MLVAMQRSHGAMFAPIAKALVNKTTDIEPLIVSGDLWHDYGAEKELANLPVAVVRLPRPVAGPLLKECATYLDLLQLHSAARVEVKKLFEDYRPTILVVASDVWGIEQFFIQSASANGIPSLLVQDGQLGEVTGRLIKSLGVYQYGFGGTTEVAVSGPAYVSRLTQHGINPARITVTGQPRYDSLFPSYLDIDDDRACLPIPEEQRIILFASQPLKVIAENGFQATVDQSELIIDVFDAVKPFLSNRAMIVKLHPAESLENYRSTVNSLAEYKENVHFVQDADIISLLKRSDLVLTVASTVGVEALLLNKPVVVLSYVFPDYRSSFSGNPAVLEVGSSIELGDTVRLALEDSVTLGRLRQARTVFLKEQVYKIDGLSADRVADLIVNIVQRPELETTAPSLVALATYNVLESIDAFRRNQVARAKTLLLQAIKQDSRLEADPTLITKAFLSHAWLLGQGKYSDTQCITFADMISDALCNSEETVFIQLRKSMATIFWQASVEKLYCERAQSRQFWMKAARINPALLRRLGFLSCGVQAVVGVTLYHKLMNMM